MAKGKIKRAADRLLSVSKKFNDDHLSAYAAQATFYLMLSFFPFVMLLCLATRLLPIREDMFLALVNLILPENYREVVGQLIDSYFNQNIGATKIILVLFLIWTASRFMQAMINGFNSVYGIEETRNQTLVRLIGCLYTLALCVLFVTLVVMYTLGTRLVEGFLLKLPHSFFVEIVLGIARNLFSPALQLSVFWLSYVTLPSRKGKFRDELPGACVTMLFWRGAAFLYSFVQSYSFERYSYVYGSLASLILILLWLYACVYAWLVGGEINWYLKKLKDEGRSPKILTETLPQLLTRFKNLFKRAKDE